MWVKLSAAYRSVRDGDGEALGVELAADLLAAFGPQRLVWGSDWPHTEHRERVDYAAASRALRRWVPDAEQRRTILVESARELFRF